MKPNLSSLLVVGALVLTSLAPASLAQRQVDPKKGPTSKLYVAETKGDTQIHAGEKIYTPRQATTFDASGTVIETKAKAHDALVYSNGTGLYVDESTRVEITRFTQEPFRPAAEAQLDTPYEPSVSQSNVAVPYGAVGICTSQLISGSTMVYSTPHALINIRGGKLSIESHPDFTIVDLLEGDVTVRHTAGDVGGKILKPGERAIIRATATGSEPLITIEPIPKEAMPVDDERVEMACNARKSVTFGMVPRKPGDAAAEGAEIVATDTAGDEAAGADGQQIVARPTVPQNPPTNIVISPDRLPGT